MGTSGSQLDKLGERIAAGEPSLGDLAVLQGWIYEHEEPMRQVAAQLSSGLVISEPHSISSRIDEHIDEIRADPGSSFLVELADRLRDAQHSTERIALAPTGRLKSFSSIQSKLGREHTRLTQIRDIAGLRVIVGDGRLRQNAVVDALGDLFPDSKVTNRREDPRAGYRAVHVTVRVDGRQIEIQVRTWLQHFYGEVMEKLGDLVGRGIRYSEAPDRSRLPGLPVSSDRAVRTLLDLAEGISSYEEAEAMCALLAHARVAGVEIDEAARSWDENTGKLTSSMTRLMTAKRWIDRRQPEVAPGGGRHDLMIYVPGGDEVLEVQTFDSYGAALAARREWELKARRNWPPGTEAVVLSADSQSNLKTTHGRYFHTLEDLGFAP